MDKKTTLIRRSADDPSEPLQSCGWKCECTDGCDEDCDCDSGGVGCGRSCVCACMLNICGNRFFEVPSLLKLDHEPVIADKHMAWDQTRNGPSSCYAAYIKRMGKAEFDQLYQRITAERTPFWNNSAVLLLEKLISAARKEEVGSRELNDWKLLLLRYALGEARDEYGNVNNESLRVPAANEYMWSFCKDRWVLRGSMVHCQVLDTCVVRDGPYDYYRQLRLTATNLLGVGEDNSWPVHALGRNLEQPEPRRMIPHFEAAAGAAAAHSASSPSKRKRTNSEASSNTKVTEVGG